MISRTWYNKNSIYHPGIVVYVCIFYIHFTSVNLFPTNNQSADWWDFSMTILLPEFWGTNRYFCNFNVVVRKKKKKVSLFRFATKLVDYTRVYNIYRRIKGLTPKLLKSARGSVTRQIFRGGWVPFGSDNLVSNFICIKILTTFWSYIRMHNAVRVP